VLAAGAVAPRLARIRGASAFGRYGTAAVYIGLGVFAAATGSRNAK
jgi:hypothetical protein